MEPLPHAKNLRSGRWSSGGYIYSITFVTYNRMPVFQTFACGRLVVRCLHNQVNPSRTLAYVVMPDHVHWLMQLGSELNLSKVVQSVKSVSAHAVNKYLSRKGKIWQAGFYDHAIRNEEDIRENARYIIANPLCAGLVKSLSEYSLWDAVWL